MEKSSNAGFALCFQSQGVQNICSFFIQREVLCFSRECRERYRRPCSPCLMWDYSSGSIPKRLMHQSSKEPKLSSLKIPLIFNTHGSRLPLFASSLPASFPHFRPLPSDLLLCIVRVSICFHNRLEVPSRQCPHDTSLFQHCEGLVWCLELRFLMFKNCPSGG